MWKCASYMDDAVANIHATLGVSDNNRSVGTSSNISTGSNSAAPTPSQLSRTHSYASNTRGTTAWRSFLIVLVSLRNVVALLVFIALNVTTLFHDPISTASLVRHHFFMQNHHEQEQVILEELFCKEDGEDSVLCLHDEEGAFMYPTPVAIRDKMKARKLFKDEQYGNVTYGTVLYENNLLKARFHYDSSCNALITSGLRHTWRSPVPFKRECCTLTLSTGGMFWHLCTTPPEEAITEEGQDREMELRGPMMHATLGLINNYYKFSGCRVEDDDSIDMDLAVGLLDEVIAQTNHLNCANLEIDFDITDTAAILGPIIIIVGMVITMICRILKLVKLFFLLLVTMKLNVFCFKRGLFFKTFAEDLMYSDPLIQKANVLICIFSFSTITMHFGLWGVHEGTDGFLSSLHLVAWGEGIFTAVVLFAKCLKLRVSSINSFALIIIGARYILPAFARDAYLLSDSCVEPGFTGHYNVDATLTIVIAMLEYAMTTVVLQFGMSFVIQMIFRALKWTPYQSLSSREECTAWWRQYLCRFGTNRITDTVEKYRMSRFEQLIQKNLSQVYGFAPVSHHQLLVKGVAYTPLEWVLTSGYFLYNGLLYQISLRNCLWVLSNECFAKLKGRPVASFSGGLLRPLSKRSCQSERGPSVANMESTSEDIRPATSISAMSNHSNVSTTVSVQKSQQGFIFTPL